MTGRSEMSSRVTRSQSRALTPDIDERDTCMRLPEHDKVPSHIPATTSYHIPLQPLGLFSGQIQPLPQNLEIKHTKLTASHHNLLLLKQQKLRHLDLSITHKNQKRRVTRSADSVPAVPTSTTGHVGTAISATLIFASESAGTAICINKSGLVLTCAHCIAESQEELKGVAKKPFWLLTATGNAVQARCFALDIRRDLAILRITHAQIPNTDGMACVDNAAISTPFPSIDIAAKMSPKHTPLICIGHPGSEDLEANQQGIPTDYPVLAISEGRFRGYAVGQDMQDNSNIGALMHDAWTYWGHSGAPLVDMQTGYLIGLHSSWDDQTRMRRGVGVDAIQAFFDHVSNTPKGILPFVKHT